MINPVDIGIVNPIEFDGIKSDRTKSVDFDGFKGTREALERDSACLPKPWHSQVIRLSACGHAQASSNLEVLGYGE